MVATIFVRRMCVTQGSLAGGGECVRRPSELRRRSRTLVARRRGKGTCGSRRSQ